jgi:putative addiction module component (TIGR02574 family)
MISTTCHCGAVRIEIPRRPEAVTPDKLCAVSSSRLPRYDAMLAWRLAMTDPVAELSQRARELAPEDRARLAEELLASLEDRVEPEVDAAWDAELRKRISEVSSGAVKLIPADEVFARVRRSLR